MALLNGRAIWLANGDGSHRRRIGSNGASAAWSPDGKTLALDLNGRLWGVNRNGTGLRRIPIEVPTCANCTSDESNPSWSPDGHTLVFEHGEAEPGSWGVGSIWAADVDDGNVRRLSDSYNPHDPRWSADGTKVAYLMDDGFGDVDYLHVVNPDGSGDHRYRPATTFTWAPHGALLAYEASSNPKRVYVIRPAGGGVALKRASAPTWAPDGRRLAFQRGSSIYMASASGKRQRRLSAGIQPSWSPDGGLLAYAGAACGAQQGIHVIRASGTGKRRLTNFCFRKRRA
jgi:Tol biopolymer transport system component